MHRWVWDLHYPAPAATRHDYPIAAIPHDTPRYPLGPTVMPGFYSVKLTVDGKSFTAPVTIKMDPRIKTSAAGLQKKFQAEMTLSSIVTDSSHAITQAESIRGQLEKLHDRGSEDVKKAVADAEKKLDSIVGTAGGFLAPPSAEANLRRLNGNASTLYQGIWQVDAEPTAAQNEAMAAVEHDQADVMKRWNGFKNGDLPGLNRMLHDAQVPEVQAQAETKLEESGVDEE